jgi:hypothetical protein
MDAPRGVRLPRGTAWTAGCAGLRPRTRPIEERYRCNGAFGEAPTLQSAAIVRRRPGVAPVPGRDPPRPRAGRPRVLPPVRSRRAPGHRRPLEPRSEPVLLVLLALATTQERLHAHAVARGDRWAS